MKTSSSAFLNLMRVSKQMREDSGDDRVRRAFATRAICPAQVGSVPPPDPRRLQHGRVRRGGVTRRQHRATFYIGSAFWKSQRPFEKQDSDKKAAGISFP